MSNVLSVNNLCKTYIVNKSHITANAYVEKPFYI